MMQKLRRPGSFEDAIVRVIDGLGREKVAELVGKSQSWVYGWSDPDSDRRPTVHQCLVLDAAYVAAGLGEAPIKTAYREQLFRTGSGHKVMHLSDRLCDVMHEVGDVAGEVRAALHPTGPGGVTVTATEYGSMSSEIAEAIDALQKMQRDLDQTFERQQKPRIAVEG
jgi:hypothetical protein